MVCPRRRDYFFDAACVLLPGLRRARVQRIRLGGEFSELEVATVVGTARQTIALERGFRDRQVDIQDPVQTHIEAAASELAVSKLTGCRWNLTVDGDGTADLYPNVEVRWATKPYYGLLVKPTDKPGRLFFLATGSGSCFRVIGWLRHDEICQQRYWRAELSKPCWVVPQEDLRPPPAP